MRVKIDVTQEDIQRGRAHSGTSCPIHWAARRVLNHVDEVADEALCLSTNRFKAEHHWITLPKMAQRWIYKLDTEGKKSISPFSFTLNVPRQFVKGQQHDHR